MESLQPFITHLSSHGLLVYPMNLRWYTTLHPKTPIFQPHQDILGLVVISDRRFFETCVIEEFTASDQTPVHVVDRALRTFLVSAISTALPPSLSKTARLYLVDRPTESGQMIHAQSLGVLAGFAEWISPGEVFEGGQPPSDFLKRLRTSRDPMLWDARMDFILPLTVHQDLGGWFAYRAVLELPGLEAVAASLSQPPQLRFLPSLASRRQLLETFNLMPEAGAWREAWREETASGTLASRAQRRYGPLQFVFFASTEAEEREKVLRLAALIKQFKNCCIDS